MSRLARIAVFTLSVIVFLYVGLGYVLGKSNEDKSYRSLTVYGEVLQHIQEDYVDEPNLSVVTSGALHGLLESLDPLSGYLSAREYADYRDRQKNAQRGEIGMSVSKRFGYIVIVSELADGPAAKAGLRDGEILEALSGFSTRDMSVEQAEMLLQGAPGTAVKMSVVRPGKTEPDEVSVNRAAIGPLHIFADRVAGGDTGYIRMASVESGDVNELHDKLVQFDKQGVSKVILDLRDCARGEVPDAVTAAQFFLSSGKIASLEGQTVSHKDFIADPDKVVWKGPVDVLIAPSTSGAAEILAGAIKGNQRGDVVGERTFGTASEQKLIPLDDGGALLLTVAFYSTPDGKSIVEEGVAPSVEVAPKPLDPSVDPDEAEPAPLAPGQLPPADDPVYNKALDLLHGGEAHKAA